MGIHKFKSGFLSYSIIFGKSTSVLGNGGGPSPLTFSNLGQIIFGASFNSAMSLGKSGADDFGRPGELGGIIPGQKGGPQRKACKGKPSI